MYKILYADDVIENRLLVKGFLRHCDCEIELLEDGLSALESIKQQDYDLGLLDMSMPGMSGSEVLKAVRELEEKAGEEDSMPLLAMTAYSADEIRAVSGNAEFTGYVHKPITRELLIDKLRKFLPEL